MAEDTRKHDRRWRKTERSLMEAFDEIISTKPLDKVTVKEVTEKADIGKGTFYLHYQDIFDLANSYARWRARCNVDEMDYLDLIAKDPDEVARRFAAEGRKITRMDPIEANGLIPVFIDATTEAICNRMRELQVMKELYPNATDEQTDMLTTFIIGGMGALFSRFAESGNEDAVKVATFAIRAISRA